MARDYRYRRDSLFQVSPESRDTPYNEPTEVALARFIDWVTSDGTSKEDRYPTPGGVASALNETYFVEKGQVPTCLYDLAYVWLVEGDAIHCCPTHESWLLFLIAFADATRYFRDPQSNGVELQELRRQKLFPTGNNETRLRELDLLYRDPSYRRGGWADADDNTQWSLHSGTQGLYQHPALRRDIYEAASAEFARLFALSPNPR